MANKMIPPLDLMFFIMESVKNPKHVGALQIFELPPNAPRNYLNNFAKALKQAPVSAPFDLVAYFPRVGMPQWHKDRDVDIDFHVRHSALRAPGGDAQLIELVQRLHAGMMDRTRPCWSCTLIEGLEGGRFALYTKMHHAYIDGASGVKRMNASLSLSPSDQTIVPPWSHSARKKSSVGHKKGALERLDSTRRTAIARTLAMKDVYGAFARMALHLLKLRRNNAQVPYDAPRTRMNKPVGSDARSIAICQLPLDRVKAVGAALGGRVNDVVLTVVDAALQDYLELHRENIAEPLVALCPMSIRAQGDDSDGTKVAVLHVRLGEPGVSISERLRQVIDSTSVAKEEAHSMSRDGLLEHALVLGGIGEALARTGLESVLPVSYNVVVSNVPGPGTETRYVNGAKLLASYPMSTFLPGSNLNATVLSQGNSLDFGLLAEKRVVPDLDVVAVAIKSCFAELELELLGANRTDENASGSSSRARAPERKRSVAAKRKTSRVKTKAKTKTKTKHGARSTEQKAPKRAQANIRPVISPIGPGRHRG